MAVNEVCLKHVTVKVTMCELKGCYYILNIKNVIFKNLHYVYLEFCGAAGWLWSTVPSVPTRHIL